MKKSSAANYPARYLICRHVYTCVQVHSVSRVRLLTLTLGVSLDDAPLFYVGSLGVRRTNPLCTGSIGSAMPTWPIRW